MNLFEQYPDYAMMTNDQGERDTKPWVSGPSPLSMGLMSAGMGMLAQPEDTSGWVTEGGGFDPTNMARGGLLGLQAFQQGHENLQGQRKDFYTHRNDLMDQVIQNQTAKREEEKYVRAGQDRERMINNFPAVLKSIHDSGRPEFQKAVPMLQHLFATDPNKAAEAAMGIISQIEPGEVKVHDVPGTNGKYITQGKKFVGQFKGSANTKYKTTLVGQKALERMQKDNPDFALQNTNVNNLAVKQNADGSIESFSYIEPNEKLTVTEQTQYNNLVEKYNTEPQYRKLTEGVSSLLSLKKLGTHNPNGRMGFNDVAMIFAFMKTLDPTSVVRESEYATAANAGAGVPEKIWKAYNQAKNGEILLPQLRREIVRAARDSLLAKEPNLIRIRKNYINRGVKIYKFEEDSLNSVFDNPFDSVRNMELPASDSDTSDLIGDSLNDNSDAQMLEDSN